MRAHQKHTLFQLIIGLAAALQSASASEFECRNGGQMRRVEVRAGGAVENLACEVRYWRDATRQGAGKVLWRASQDTDFCDAKAAGLIDRLEAGGWRCAAVDQPAPSAPLREAETTTPAPSAPLPAPEPQMPQVPPRIEPGAGPTEQERAPGPTEQATLPTPEPSTPQAPSPIEPAAGPTDQAVLPSPSTAGSAEAAQPAILEQVVAQTLRNVQQMYGGQFRAEGTVFGDLDGDGRDDAAVLVTYEAERDDYVQYLVAYLFDGETYQSTDTENVGGRFLDALRAEIREIVDQTIVVELQSLDADQECCETRRAAFVLQNGELVEVEGSAGVHEGHSDRSTASKG
jgi:hypothetical protein